MFEGCSSLASLDMSSFDTSKVTNMSRMFYDCRQLTDIYVGTLWTEPEDSSAKTDMFAGCGTDHVTVKQ